eukprot:TRINITY_DN70350_c0_g1_i1.p1 TRINITY_DN70350_c0_g1~~TRINITY_DN70350_c0_g1_i1.p1  ORF type:complete len:199 (+),score=23.91 TRINITY_DN70350_c0_g1_i1:28-624(+)
MLHRAARRVLDRQVHIPKVQAYNSKWKDSKLAMETHKLVAANRQTLGPLFPADVDSITAAQVNSAIRSWDIPQSKTFLSTCAKGPKANVLAQTPLLMQVFYQRKEQGKLDKQSYIIAIKALNKSGSYDKADELLMEFREKKKYKLPLTPQLWYTALQIWWVAGVAVSRRTNETSFAFGVLCWALPATIIWLTWLIMSD